MKEKEEQKIKSSNPWVIAVKKLLNLTDEAKLEKFHALMVKKYQKDIANNTKKKIAIAETLEEKLYEAQEVLEDKIDERDTIALKVDPAKLEQRELRDTYIATFDQNLAIVLENVDKQKAYMDNLKKEADAKIQELDAQILLIQAKLALLKVK